MTTQNYVFLLTIYGQHRQDGGRVHANLEGMNPICKVGIRIYRGFECKSGFPQEGDGRCSLDAAPVNVACCTGNNTTDSESDNDRDVLEERRAEHLSEDDANEG